jgi:predicted GNAT family acetyltransferase
VLELAVGRASLTYARPEAGVLDLQHTFVPAAARGEGAGEALVEAALDFARREGARIVPSCPYVRGYLARHPEAADLVGTPPSA